MRIPHVDHSRGSRQQRVDANSSPLSAYSAGGRRPLLRRVRLSCQRHREHHHTVLAPEAALQDTPCQVRTILIPITMSILHVIRRWRELKGRQQAWLAVFVVVLPLVRLSLRTRGYARTRAWVERWSAKAHQRLPSRLDVHAADELARLAGIAGHRGVIAATCLPQALAVYGAIRRRGLAPSLQIGVRKLEGNFEAHAWVELAGIALAQPDLDHKPLPLP